LSAGGWLSGPLAANGTFNFSLRVTDGLAATADQPLSLTVNRTNTPTLGVGLAGGQVIVLWPAAAGTNYTLLMTTNVETGPWVPATNAVPVIAFTFTNNLPASFFKLR
jgi:hypothetical protein